MKALLITYHFPPDAEIGGVRPLQIARYLPQFGVECWVLTVAPEFAETLNPGLQAVGVREERITRTQVGSTIRDRVLGTWRTVTPRRRSTGAAHSPGLDRAGGLRDWVLSWLSYPDGRIGWYHPALEAAGRLVRREGFDVLVSTSPPRVAALIACELSRRHGLPWVMDLRDPWSMGWEGEAEGFATPRPWLSRLFRRCVTTASRVVHNTDRLRQLTCRLVPEVSGKTLCIPNGCDPGWQVLQFGGPSPQTFAIGYYGQIMGRRSPEAFLRGLRLWLDAARPDMTRITVRFVGAGFEAISGLLASLGLDRVVSLHPPVPRGEVPGLMAHDFVLLLLANAQPMQVPGKTYEYLATGRRILALTEDDSATGDLLRLVEGCAVADSPQQMASALQGFYEDFRRGEPPWLDRAAVIEEAQYPRRVERLAGVLGEIVGERRAAA